MKALSWNWLFGLSATAASCFLSVWFLDLPVVGFFAPVAELFHLHRYGVGAPFFIVPIALGVFYFGSQLLRGRALSRVGEAVLVAGCSACGAFALNDLLFKPLFGRDTVIEYLSHPYYGTFSLFHGGWRSSFPSGHTVIATSIITVLWKFYPRWYPAYVAILAIMTFILLAGEWHFVSDIIAGGYLGISVGLITVDGWRSGRLKPSASAKEQI